LAVCSAKSPLSGRTLTVADLPTIPLALRENGSGTLAIVDDELSKKGMSLSSLRVLIRLGGTEALKNFALADSCLAFLPKRAIIKELAAGELVVVPILDLMLQRTFYFIQRKGTESNRLVNTFIQFMIRHYSNRE
jgi:DNA-binding transcriptional LysR family regulator